MGADDEIATMTWIIRCTLIHSKRNSVLGQGANPHKHCEEEKHKDMPGEWGGLIETSTDFSF